MPPWYFFEAQRHSSAAAAAKHQAQPQPHLPRATQGHESRGNEPNVGFFNEDGGMGGKKTHLFNRPTHETQVPVT